MRFEPPDLLGVPPSTSFSQNGDEQQLAKGLGAAACTVNIVNCCGRKVVVWMKMGRVNFGICIFGIVAVLVVITIGNYGRP